MILFCCCCCLLHVCYLTKDEECWLLKIKALKIARKIKPNHCTITKPYVWTEKKRARLRMNCKCVEIVYIFTVFTLSMHKCVCVCKNHHPKMSGICQRKIYFIWFATVWLFRYKRPFVQCTRPKYNNDVVYAPMRLYSVTVSERFWNEHAKSLAIFLHPFIFFSICHSLCVCFFLRLYFSHWQYVIQLFFYSICFIKIITIFKNPNSIRYDFNKIDWKLI